MCKICLQGIRVYKLKMAEKGNCFLWKYVFVIYIPVLYFLHVSNPFFPDGISRRMVRNPPGVLPLTNFIGQEPEYDDKKFVATPVKKGTAHKFSEDKWL